MKTLDLAIGPPVEAVQRAVVLDEGTPAHYEGVPGDVYKSLEAKAVKTEHGKRQPHVFDELNSSQRIVHEGRADAIAAEVGQVDPSRTK